MRQAITLILGMLVVLWTACSIFMVARFGGAVVLDPATTGRIMAVQDDGVIHSAVGLTYHGVGGAALVIAEILLVLGAIVYSFSRRPWRRALGALVLIAWTGLWFGNAWWLRAVGWDFPLYTTLLGVAVVCVTAWLLLRFIFARSGDPSAPVRSERETGAGAAPARR
jgi:hypothetical protein